MIKPGANWFTLLPAAVAFAPAPASATVYLTSQAAQQACAGALPAQLCGSVQHCLIRHA